MANSIPESLEPLADIWTYRAKPCSGIVQYKLAEGDVVTLQVVDGVATATEGTVGDPDLTLVVEAGKFLPHVDELNGIIVALMKREMRLKSNTPNGDALTSYIREKCAASSPVARLAPRAGRRPIRA